MSAASAPLAFAAGVLTVAAPCVLPMLPIVLGGTLQPGRSRTRPLAITAGFVAAFAGLTIAFSLVSSLLGLSADALRKAAIAGLLLFGVSMLWPRWLQALSASARWPRFSRLLLRRLRSPAMPGSRAVPPAGDVGGLALGLTLGAVWTPCAGPVLGTILTLLATEPDPRRAGWLLACFALGAGLPMLAIGYGGQFAAARVRAVARWLPALQPLFGVLVIGVALAMLFQVDVLFTSWATRFLPSISQGL